MRCADNGDTVRSIYTRRRCELDSINSMSTLSRCDNTIRYIRASRKPVPARCLAYLVRLSSRSSLEARTRRQRDRPSTATADGRTAVLSPSTLVVLSSPPDRSGLVFCIDLAYRARHGPRDWNAIELARQSARLFALPYTRGRLGGWG